MPIALRLQLQDPLSELGGHGRECPREFLMHDQLIGRVVRCLLEPHRPELLSRS